MSLFDSIKRIKADGSEYRSARDLYKILEYTEYSKILPIIQKAQFVCQNSKQNVHEGFAHVSEPQKSFNQHGTIAGQIISDIHLSRYACYLIAMEADPRKKAVALAKTYFAIQTHKQEMNEQLMLDTQRVHLRNEMKTHNKNLAATAKKADVTNYGQFTDAGYMGLYGGMKQHDIHTAKKLTKSQSILDHMDSEELAANLFRATQTQAKLAREGVVGQTNANMVHYEIGKKVRKTIAEIDGTMPERLPVVENITHAEKRIKKNNKIE